MPDLNEIQSAGSTKIVGSDPTGLETTPLAVETDGAVRAKINNASGADAVHIQDGGNSITVDDGSGSLTVDSAQLPAALGQTTMIASLGVVIASNQSDIPVTAASLPLPVGAATAENQTSEITLLTNIESNQILNIAILSGALSVGNPPTEAKVGVGRLANRKAVIITPTGGTIYWGHSNSVNASTGTPIFKNQSYPLAIGDVAIWLYAATTTDVRIVEGS